MQYLESKFLNTKPSEGDIFIELFKTISKSLSHFNEFQKIIDALVDGNFNIGIDLQTLGENHYVVVDGVAYYRTSDGLFSWELETNPLSFILIKLPLGGSVEEANPYNSESISMEYNSREHTLRLSYSKKVKLGNYTGYEIVEPLVESSTRIIFYAPEGMTRQSENVLVIGPEVTHLSSETATPISTGVTIKRTTSGLPSSNLYDKNLDLLIEAFEINDVHIVSQADVTSIDDNFPSLLRYENPLISVEIETHLVYYDDKPHLAFTRLLINIKSGVNKGKNIDLDENGINLSDTRQLPTARLDKVFTEIKISIPNTIFTLILRLEFPLIIVSAELISND